MKRIFRALRRPLAVASITAIVLTGMVTPTMAVVETSPVAVEPTATTNEPRGVSTVTESPADKVEEPVGAVESVTNSAESTVTPPTKIQSLAKSGSNDVSVSIRPLDTTVKAGEGVSFEIQWQCGSTSATECVGGKLEVPVPQGQPDNIDLAVASYTSVSGHPVTVVGTGANRKIVWDMPSPIAPGTTGSVSFMLTSQNYITPDDTSVTAAVTFTANEGTAEAISTPVKITSELGLKIKKSKIQPSEDPYVDQDVTYQIQYGYPSQFNASGGYIPYRNICNQVGLWGLKAAKVVDTLPPGTTFKMANLGGVYDPVAHTVTWNVGDSIKFDQDGVPECDGDVFGQELLVVVNYPAGEFTDDATNGTLQSNNVKVNAAPWLRPNAPVSAEAKAEHYVRIGASGDFTLQKGLSYAASNKASWGLNRGRTVTWSDSVAGYLHEYSITGSGNASGKWSMTDVLPCGWTSPTDVNKTDCSTPAYKDIAFGANGALAEVKVNWITNTGRTGICTIPEGFVANDTTIRLCQGLASSKPISMATGEWITKFWLDNNPVKAGTKGSLFLFGSISRDLPLDNSAAVASGDYQPHHLTTATGNPPLPGVTPASAHPLWATVENCLADNTVNINGGGTSTTNGTLVDSNKEGRCGYTRVIRTPLNLWNEKHVYDPASGLPVNQQALVNPGDSVRVEVETLRESWAGATDDDLAAARYTPVITEILPENMVYAPNDSNAPIYLKRVSYGGFPAGDASAVVAKLGEPKVTVSEVQVGGKTRQQVKVEFPDAPAAGGLAVRERITIGFDVKIKEGTPAATYQNYLMVQAPKQAQNEYFACNSGGGTLVDPKIADPVRNWGDLVWTTGVQGPDVDSGCRVQKPYTVVEGPGMSAAKQVQGSYDDKFVSAPGIGNTDGSGDAEYRIPVVNTGNVDMRDVVVYDMLPRINDHGVRPGADVRGSAFDVFMTGPITGLPSSAVVKYSKAANPCRGELAGTGGGSLTSAPVGCTNDWSAGTPANWSEVTAIRIDFGPTVWKPLEKHTASFPVTAGDTGDLTGIAWNNVAIAGNRNSSGLAMLPTEAPKVGIRLLPDLSWSKVDGVDGTSLLSGSEWLLAPVLVDGAKPPVGTWPLSITDCLQAPCSGTDQDPAAGKFLVKGIPWGSYDLKETKAPSGYALLKDPLRVVIGSASMHESSFVFPIGAVKNFKPGVDVTWTKVDSSAKALSGSEWEFVPVNDSGLPLEGGTAIQVIDCIAKSVDDCTGPDKDPAAGKFKLSKIAAGTYHLVETKAPAGFIKLTEPIKVTVTDGAAVVIGDITNKQIEVPTLPLTGGLGTFSVIATGLVFLALMIGLALWQNRRRRITH